MDPRHEPRSIRHREVISARITIAAPPRSDQTRAGLFTWRLSLRAGADAPDAACRRSGQSEPSCQEPATAVVRGTGERPLVICKPVRTHSAAARPMLSACWSMPAFPPPSRRLSTANDRSRGTCSPAAWQRFRESRWSLSMPSGAWRTTHAARAAAWLCGSAGSSSNGGTRHFTGWLYCHCKNPARKRRALNP